MLFLCESVFQPNSGSFIRASQDGWTGMCFLLPVMQLLVLVLTNGRGVICVRYFHLLEMLSLYTYVYCYFET